MFGEPESSQRPTVPRHKKRRLQGACDICRQKKIRCDSANMPGKKCSNCVAFGSECTHIAASAKGRMSHITSDQHEPVKEDLQVHINAILSDTIPYVVPNNNTLVRAILVDLACYVRQLEADLAAAKSLISVSSVSPQTSQSPEYPSDNDDEADDSNFVDALRRFTISTRNVRYFDASSGMMLIKSAIEMKKAYSNSSPITPAALDLRRPVFWTVYPWQRPISEDVPPLRFPPPDLLDHLVSIFLNTTNVHFFILHGPTFRREIAARTHFSVRDFGNLVLGVCAVASRHSDDPRVGPPAHAGWEWYLQLRPIHLSRFSAPATLWELQLYPLMVLFLYGTTTPEATFLIIGVGVRLAQDVGAHRKRVKTLKEWTIEDELWKRIFWALVITDVFVSAFVGRPRATTSEHFDVELPLEVDDDYWPGEVLADPEHPWTQPSDKLADVKAWVLHIKLLDILSFAQATIYTMKRSAYWDAISTPEWHQNIVVELDSALNEWIDSIPDYLRWDLHKSNQYHFDQSALLYSTYYWVQMQVHRKFIPSPNTSKDPRKLNSGFLSLSICANAARSCSHIVDTHAKTGILALPNILVAVFHSALVLLLNLWGGKRLGLSTNPSRALEDVFKCMNVMRKYEDRYLVAGRY
ncbi:fungal-specific transcription factor domain-containing protein [Armillaria novae-zelandiae]|uniref:Fungal-specific transcription factor domain-containing protein n=1 Tax=Armillaria novae-zelandiae TaxID=153914 RepID=A0AA39PRQ8_9AGAR|nr:fungal-specific transcription factor domain-containing protein [Armillaria novae-zelandiae]